MTKANRLFVPPVAALFAALLAWPGAATAQAKAKSTRQPPRPVPIGLNRVPRAGNAAHEQWAKDLDLNFVHEITQWIEPKQGQYVWSGKSDKFGMHLRELKQAGYAVSITLTNVHMDQKHLPAYLKGKRFDDPVLLKRWETYLRIFLTLNGDAIDFLNIGNEVNNYFGKHPKEWPAYVTFLRRGVRVAKQLKPHVRVGVVLVHDRRAEYWKAIEPLCDHLAITYYTPCSLFSTSPTRNALDPQHAVYFAHTLDRALALAGTKKVLITEVGCATHPSLDSSPELQVRFIGQLFGWLRRRQSRVLGMSWLAAQDWPYEHTKKALAGQLDARLLKHERFMRFLTSLGLRYEDGRKKPGYDAYKKAIILYRRGR